ncbi:MAG: putative metal-dependent hydrolase [Acidobacteriota bacterium]|nr:putative metal-dependent hydrolase [Acidobacteriota bacterium]
MTTDDTLWYRIGRVTPSPTIDWAQVNRWIDDIATLPANLRRTVTPLTNDQLDTTHRPDGWTLRQVVHHVPDSHLNSLVRCKWTLTEERPVIKASDEKRWATLPDVTAVSVGAALDLLESVHVAWVDLLRGLSWAQLQRGFVHPESGPATLAKTVGADAGHGRHHLAHIQRTLDRKDA